MLGSFSVENGTGTPIAAQRLAVMTSAGDATRQLQQGTALLSDFDLQDGSMLLLVRDKCLSCPFENGAKRMSDSPLVHANLRLK
jgi:hypothetical protein